MNNYMKTRTIIVLLSFVMTACTSMPSTEHTHKKVTPDNTLLVYQDGRMEFNSRFLDDKDVVIYADGRGGERAAIKVRVPLHPDFYRDSIVVVRVKHKFEEAITQRENTVVNNIN